MYCRTVRLVEEGGRYADDFGSWKVHWTQKNERVGIPGSSKKTWYLDGEETQTVSNLQLFKTKGLTYWGRGGKEPVRRGFLVGDHLTQRLPGYTIFFTYFATELNVILYCAHKAKTT